MAGRISLKAAYTKSGPGMRAPGGAIHGRYAARRLRLGCWLALLALALRLVAPALTAPPLTVAAPPQADAAELVRLFGVHAFCVSPEAGEAGPGPADRPASDETDHRFGTCCFWHCNAGLSALPPIAVELVVFLLADAPFPAATPAVVAARRSGIARARAPPRDA